MSLGGFGGMGYTHYWSNAETINPAAWAAFAEGTRAIAARSPIPIGAWDGDGDPEVTDEIVNLNAPGDQGYENLCIQPGPNAFVFCKTERKPYDVVITAVLALAAEAGFIVTSDGKESDWEAGVALASEALGRPVANPLGGKS
jgi:hypothetical protein